MKEALFVEGIRDENHYLLTITGAPVAFLFNKALLGYDVTLINENVDFVNLLTLDFYGNNPQKLSYVSPLECKDDQDFLCVSKSVQSWLDNHLCPRKLVLGEHRRE